MLNASCMSELMGSLLTYRYNHVITVNGIVSLSDEKTQEPAGCLP